MWEDPIVAEVHRAREAIAAQYNHDLAAYLADVQKRQEALGDRLVYPKADPPVAVEAPRHPDPAHHVSSDASPAV